MGGANNKPKTMEKRKDNYCVILAGGRGRRLWPYSRDKQPKQFIDIFGTGRTLLQATYDRFIKILPRDNIFVCTAQDYLAQVREQLPDVLADQIIVEPVCRNTAPSVSCANLHIYKRCNDARVIVAPSDQMIINEEAFLANVLTGLDFVDLHDVSLTMGIKPTRPEPGYGYVQMGDATEVDGVYRVKSFTEKPEREFAKMFMASGEFMWNTGIFLFSTKHLYKLFIDVFVEDYRHLKEIYPHADIDDAIAFTKEYYSSAPNLSIDYAVLEKREDNCRVMKCDFGWADIGTWHSMYESMSKGEGDNVVVDSNVILEDCRGNILKLPKGKLGVINGLEGYIVVDSDDVLLICKKEDSSAQVRKFINMVQLKFDGNYM